MDFSLPNFFVGLVGGLIIAIAYKAFFGLRK